MHGLIRENNSFGANPGTKDLARHMYTRMRCGQIVIVADDPDVLLPPLRRQWLKLCRKVQRERASTLNALRISELTESVQQMQGLRFSAKWHEDSYDTADVYLATTEQLLAWAPESSCRTLYVTCEIKPEQLYVITSMVREGAVLVQCKMC